MDLKNMTLKERFDAKGFSVVKYARAYGLCQPTLSLILGGDEMTTGKRRSRKGNTRKAYMKLKEDGVWIGALPWEVGHE